MHRRPSPTLVLGGLAITLVAATLIAAGAGQVSVSPAEIIGSILHKLGLQIGPLPSEPQGEAALWVVRFPRVVMAIAVGASLGVSGALMQGLFGNPLAEPGVIGVSSGAAVGAFTIIVFGTAAGGWPVAGAAFIGGLVATAIVYSLSRAGGRTEAVTLVLTGMAVNAFTGAAIGLLTFLSQDDAIRAMAFWSLGSLARSTWGTVAIVLPACLIGVAIALAASRRLDLMSLGDRAARHLGVDVERLRLTLIVVVALLVASGVAFTGIIAFVGLVVPHIVRMALGPAHRTLVVGSALGGALVVVVADLIARTAVPYQELPLGVLTALVGGPFFIWLLRRNRRLAGGWAAD